MKKQDLRIIRTDRRIRETFLQLIDEVGFDAVTIKLLTDRAEVNRGTFYHHYADKYELLERMTNEIFEKIEATFEREIPFVLINKTEDSPYRRIIPFLIFLYENRTLMRILLSPTSDGMFRKRVRDYMQQILFSGLHEQGERLVPEDYLIAYLSAAHLGVIESWLSHPNETTPEEIARIIFTISMEGPFRAAGFRR
ncbi:TetR/AcrR family transcriptional regulator [Exiguobacterium acetylicum]|uniref:TetR/AcrR family transcriptional regulator n=1 Tax=Exiguobacterium TaxID=33986 RepID=UPI000445CA02|nr:MULTISPECIES: TetR/AcrR family transcriptional regulator [Exiguobacterium]EZP61151.1 TetR family transcriptional regulator [Exiguobacterium sp. RIT341]MDQ6466814.1 TetR/AcrR family transcriptional regulator [Exiguobacterium acetylicum]